MTAHSVLHLAVINCSGAISLTQDIGYIRSHYNVEDFVYFDYHCPEEHAHLHHCVLNPAFAPHTKHFIKVRERHRCNAKICKLIF